MATEGNCSQLEKENVAQRRAAADEVVGLGAEFEDEPDGDESQAAIDEGQQEIPQDVLVEQAHEEKDEG